MTAEQLIAELQHFPPDSEVWIIDRDLDELNLDEMSVVVGVTARELDDEMSREIARKRYNEPTLREPVLRITLND